jgi:hypothetical protein
MRSQFGKLKNLKNQNLLDVVSMILVVIIILWSQPDSRTLFLFPILGLLAFILLLINRKVLAIVLCVVITIITATFLVNADRILPEEWQSKIDSPIFSVSGVSDLFLDLSNYVRQSTPVDALFLTPPKFGTFRISAQRAIVVDFISFPFQDDAMLEWRKRLFTCYGIPINEGFAVINELSMAYNKITDAEIEKLQKIYGFEYAVLYANTSTNYQVIYGNKEWKLIQLVSE